MDIQIGDIIVGKVESVKPYALFMSFENDVKGLLHISEIDNGYIRDIEKYASIGDILTVKVLAIDSKNGFLRVSYKQVPDEQKNNSHGSNKQSVNTEDIDFSPLAEKLPSWIEKTLAKAKKEK